MIGPLVLVLALAGAYAAGVARVRSSLRAARAPGRGGSPACRAWPVARSAAFGAGVLAVAVALLPPLDTAAEQRLSAHMAQHLLLGLVAPLCLASGAPARLALAATRGPVRRWVGRVLHALPLRPAYGWAAWSAVMLGTHLTGLYELALRDPFVHALEHMAYLGSGLLFWVPLVAADPLPRPPGPAARLVWLLAAMPPMGVVGARLLTGSVAYPSYPSLADQRTAAGEMWGAGSLLMSAALVAIVFTALVREETRQRRREAAAR